MEIQAQLTLTKVRFDKETEAHLVVSLTAPATAEAKRPPLCMIPVIDVSPSMLDNNKLAYAKKSLIKLIEHLTPHDYCGLIKFSTTAEEVQRPVRCTVEAKEDLKRKVMELKTGNATNIADALLMGFETANSMDLAPEVITRVILFTDGEANRGPAVKTEDILALVKPNMGISSVSAFGYGVGANQDLLLGLATNGNGNYAFVQNPDDALSAFGKELGGLLSTYATNFVVEIEPLAGHAISQVVTDVDAEEEDMGQVTIKFPELLSEETRHLVLAVKLKEQNNAFPRDVNVLDVKIGYDVLDANFKREHKTMDVKAKVQFVKAGEEQAKPDQELDRLVGLAQMVRAQLEADELAKGGHYSRAAGVLDSFSIAAVSRGLGGLGGVASNLSRGLVSREAYVSSASYRASVTRGATRGYGGTYSDDASMDLQSIGVAMSNSSQILTSNSFTVDNTVHDGHHIGDAPPVRDVSNIGPTQIGDTSVRADWYVDPNPQSSRITWTSDSAPPLGGSHGLLRPIVSNPLLPISGGLTVTPSPAPEKSSDKQKAKKRKTKIKQKSDRW